MILLFTIENRWKYKYIHVHFFATCVNFKFYMREIVLSFNRSFAKFSSISHLIYCSDTFQFERKQHCEGTMDYDVNETCYWY